MKNFALATLAALLLATAALVPKAEARCWWNGYHWRCGYPQARYWHNYYHHPYAYWRHHPHAYWNYHPYAWRY